MTGPTSAAGNTRPEADRWFSATTLRRLLPVVVGVPGCFAAGWFELTRALGGRQIAWVYAFEWPLYGVAGAYMWWRIWHRPTAAARTQDASDDDPRTRKRPLGLAEVPDQRQATAPPAPEDAELAAWRQYLARLHAIDPPGGPPPRS
ncbi:MAG: hypothetical protein QOJ62_1425 [Actinomycetota bacterium]|jgi:hypothetical protein|nr:hypothetical protein [Actinomycetota bacterium]